MAQSRAISFVLITLVIDAMGIGLMMPVMPELIRDVTGEGLSRAALWGGVLSTSFAVMQFLFGPLLGNLSDRYGRRPILLASLAVMTADYLLMAVAGSVWVLLLARLVSGVAAATQSTAAAYIADISRPEDKAARFGLTGAAFGVGFVLGPAIGGLLGELGPRAPFYAAAILAGLNLAFGWFVLPETVDDRIRRRFEWRRANPLGALRHLRRLPGLARMFLLVFLYDFAFIVYPATWAFFGQERFGWSTAMIGLSLAAFGIASATVQGGLIRPILRKLGERRTVALGLGISLVEFLLMTQVSVGWVALALIPLAAVGGIVTPALQGMMSRRAPDTQQGELQGALTSTRALAAILSPLVMTGAFSHFTGPSAPIYFPGVGFAIAAALMVAGGTVFVATPRAATGSANQH